MFTQFFHDLIFLFLHFIKPRQNLPTNKLCDSHLEVAVTNKGIFMQIEEFKKFAADPDAYKNICSKIAPSIFGHDDVKKAMACLLFGGSRKVYPFSVVYENNLILSTATDHMINVLQAEFTGWSETKR